MTKEGFQKGHTINVGRKFALSRNKKISLAKKGVKQTLQHIESNRRTRIEYYKTHSAPMKGQKFLDKITPETNTLRKQKISATLKKLYSEGKRQPITTGNKWKKIRYKNYLMRSSWEVNYAKHLDNKNLTWEYEPKIFHCKTTKYIPDFYIKEFNLYVEIKGYWYPNARKKVEEFRECYPQLNLIIIERGEGFD